MYNDFTSGYPPHRTHPPSIKKSEQVQVTHHLQQKPWYVCGLWHTGQPTCNKSCLQAAKSFFPAPWPRAQILHFQHSAIYLLRDRGNYSSSRPGSNRAEFIVGEDCFYAKENVINRTVIQKLKWPQRKSICNKALHNMDWITFTVTKILRQFFQKNMAEGMCIKRISNLSKMLKLRPPLSGLHRKSINLYCRAKGTIG